MNKQDNPHAKGLSVNEDVMLEEYQDTKKDVFQVITPKVVINAMQSWVAQEVSNTLIFMGIPLIGADYSIPARLFYIVVTPSGFYFEKAVHVKDHPIYCLHNGMDKVSAMLARPKIHYSDRSGLALTNPEE